MGMKRKSASKPAPPKPLVLRQPSAGKSDSSATKGSQVPRVISFIVLLAILLLVGAVFFQVMAQFLVPLFLASVLLVVFEPLHRWALWRLPGRPRIAALLTTVLILLVVLLPLTWLGLNAYWECLKLLNPKATAARSTESPLNQSAASKQKTGASNLVSSSDTSASNAGGETSDQAASSDVVEVNNSQLAERLTHLANNLVQGFERITHIKVTAEHEEKLIGWATSFGGNILLTSVRSALGIVIGLAIMVVALYYFLADGPGMVRALMQLSPLDARYEQELLERFGSVSRAVVVAILLSALVQGSFAGIGYYLALPADAPVFLLTLLTMICAMIPFVGAGLVWVPVCLWVLFYGEQVVNGQVIHDGNTIKAIMLAIYSAVVVSGVDNIIKPFVLHGQSNLHPLLALLSILGGVQVLGPVGILVGPMLVSFLQALLNMLRIELDSFSDEEVVETDENGAKHKLAHAAAVAALEAVEDVAHAAANEEVAKSAGETPSPKAATNGGKVTSQPAKKRR